MSSSSASLEEAKKNIRALLISAPRGLSVDDIEHDYRAMLGKPLPYKDFKCRTCTEFLKTLPDVVHPVWINGSLILRGIADSSTRHIAKLVARQKTSSRSRRVSKPAICTKPLVVPNYFRRNIKELLLSYPHGILGSALNSAYARNYGEEINYAKLGFKSMSHLLGSMNDIATIIKDNKGGFRVCLTKGRRRSIPEVKIEEVKRKPPDLRSTPTQPQRVCKPVETRKPTTDLTSLEKSETRDSEKNLQKCVENLLDSKCGVSEELKEELISVLSDRPNGIWAARLPFEYKAKLNKTLPVTTLGFYSVIELASALPDVIRIARPFVNGDWMLLLAEKSKKAKNITNVHIPTGAVGKGVCFPQQLLPDSKSIGVYVTHIKSPDWFWIQLAECGDALKELEENMGLFYNSKQSAQFLMDDGLVKLGQVCVAKFPDNNLWYRALITGTPMPHLTEVFYVDYGNSSQVFKSDLRLLKKEYFLLPPCAIKSRLANVKPKSQENWPPSAAYRLNELTEDKQLYCWVTERKEDVLCLCICDTTSDVDVHINDLLVDEGFAVFKNVTTPNINVTAPQVDTTNTTPCTVSTGQTTRSRPPGLPSPSAKQRAEQKMHLESINNNLLDYSFPPNMFPYTSLPLINHAAPALEPFLSVPQEEQKPSTVVEEEKPSEEDLEFMRQVCQELSEEVMSVKRLDLPEGNFIHLINFQDKPYVIRSEISALLWEADYLRMRLKEKKIVVLKEVIAREDHEELFNELKRLKVRDFDVDEIPEYATLYELSNVAKILEAFKHPSPETIERIKEEKMAFDENPSFWINNADDSNDDSSETEEANLEELKLALRALQFRRKRIVGLMVQGHITPGENTVDEVDEVEKQIENIRDMIRKAEEKEPCKDKEESSNQNNEENPIAKEITVNAELTVPSSCVNSTSQVKPPSPKLKEEKPATSVIETTTPPSLCVPPAKPTKPKDATVEKSEPINQAGGHPIQNLFDSKNSGNKGQGNQHYRVVVETAKKTIETISFSNSQSRQPVPNKSVRIPPGQMTSPFHAVPQFPNGLPAFLGPMPQPGLIVPGGNTVPGFRGYIRPFPPMPGAFPDMAIPPGGLYQQPGFDGQPPLGPIFFPWNQPNPLCPRPFYGANVRARPGH